MLLLQLSIYHDDYHYGLDSVWFRIFTIKWNIDWDVR